MEDMYDEKESIDSIVGRSIGGSSINRLRRF